MSSSSDKILAAAKKFADEAKVFHKGCSEMVKAAYSEGGVKIPDGYSANDIMNKYPALPTPQPGDIAGWTDTPHGHVVIILSDSGDQRYSNCPGVGKATKYNKNMGQTLQYCRPS